MGWVLLQPHDFFILRLSAGLMGCTYLSAAHCVHRSKCCTVFEFCFSGQQLVI